MELFDFSAFRGDGARAFAALFATVFATILGVGIVVPMMPIYAKSMGASGVWLGLMFSAFSMARLLFMPFVGRLSDRLGRKSFIVWGLLIYVGVSIGYIFARNIYELTGVRFINGIGSAMVVPIAMAYAGDIAPEGKEGLYMGTLNSALFIGLGTGPLLGGVLTDIGGMEAAFIAFMVLVSLALLPAIFMLPSEYSGVSHNSEPAAWRTIAAHPTVRALFIYRMINAIGRGTLLAFLPLLASEHGLSAGEIGVIISANIILTGVLQMPFGVLADKWNKPALVIFGTLIFVACFGALPLGKGFIALLLLSVVMGVAGAVSLPAASAITVEVGAELGMGSVMSVFNMAMSLGLIISPLISGVVIDIANLDAAFYIGAAISLFGTLFLFPLATNRYRGFNVK